MLRGDSINAGVTLKLNSWECDFPDKELERLNEELESEKVKMKKLAEDTRREYDSVRRYVYSPYVVVHWSFI